MSKNVNIVFTGFTEQELIDLESMVDQHSKDYEAKIYEGESPSVNNTSVDVANHVLPRPKKL